MEQLNALRQQTARLLGRGMDALKLVCTWDQSRLPKGRQLFITVNGLLLQVSEARAPLPRYL